MLSRTLKQVILWLGLAASMPILARADTRAPQPAITAIRGNLVLVKVPPGFKSVVLRQRTAPNVWRALGVRKTDPAGGSVGFHLKSEVALRALRVTGERATASTSSVAAGISLFPADPALQTSNGFFSAGGVTPGVVAFASAAGSGSLSDPSTPSRAVAESDIWRVAGDRLYFFNELRGLQVFDVANPAIPALLGQLREPNHGEQMYLLDVSHVVLLTRPAYFFSLAAASLLSAKGGDSGAVIVVDVTQGKPEQIARVTYPGFLVESRLVGTALYVVSEVSDASQSGLQVTSFDLRDPAHPKLRDTLLLGSYGGVVSATERFLFVVRDAANWRHSTIDVIDISAPDGTLARRGRITTAGRVNDKFKLHLEGDILTTVSDAPRDWAAEQSPTNTAHTVIETFTLANPAAPARLGSLMLGAGESVRATRFADGRLYVVTFFSIDPLWVVDLSQPAQPKLLGELQVPGFSNYIDPLGDRLVAVGQVGAQTAISLFDVSDPAQPKLLSQIPLGDGYSYSEANWDEKALSVIPEENLILVPYSGYDRNTGWASRVQLIDLTRDALQPRGVIDQGFASRRTAVVHERILAISASDLVTVDFADRDHPQVISDVEIAWRVDRVFLAGNYLVQVGGSANWSSAAAPTIAVSTAADPNAALTVFDLENVPVTGATVRDGRLYLAQQTPNAWGPIFDLATAGTTGAATAPAKPLILSVFDLTQLPAVKLLGRTETAVDAGYGTSQWEAAWPSASTLVWLRPQWTSWWWAYPVSLADANLPGTLTGSVSFTNPGQTIVASSILSAGATGRTNGATLHLAASNSPTPSGAGVISGASATASALATNTMMRWLPPWYRGNSGHEMIVFDVTNAATPAFLTKLDVRFGQSGDWSAPIVLGSKLYLSSVAYDESDANQAATLSRKYRHFMRVVDFSAAANPGVSDEVNIPGRLLAVTQGGSILLTVGCRYGAAGQPGNSRAFHASRFDGHTAQLSDQLETPSPYDPYALHGETLLLGTWPLGAGQAGRIQAWRAGDDGKFTLGAEVTAPTFTSLAEIHGLLVGFGDGLPHLYDLSDPAHIVVLGDLDTSELTSESLRHADGGAGLGIWEPLGDYGVGFVVLPH
ncbi:MAG: hypothetical protein QOE70_376 [Chthoniobacter sp.]|jgi:hypothetical protein|nr:hypothetical protein [Chthoniobacter sp.]